MIITHEAKLGKFAKTSRILLILDSTQKFSIFDETLGVHVAW